MRKMEYYQTGETKFASLAFSYNKLNNELKNKT